MQPDVLPSAFPNLLVNGASGIAVGMATNMAPHNLIEVVAAARYLLEFPDATLEDLMAFVPGARPSRPAARSSGSTASAMPTRPGAARSRPAAKVSIESVTARKTGLVVTELPYLVGPERVIEKIKDGVQSKKISGISDVTDLTDRSQRAAAGDRHQDRVQPGCGARAALPAHAAGGELLDQQRRAGRRRAADARAAGAAAGLPRPPPRRGHARRSEYRLARRRERLHLVEGLLIAILDIDEVIQVIRASDDSRAGARPGSSTCSTSATCRPSTSSSCGCAGSRSSAASSSRPSGTRCAPRSSSWRASWPILRASAHWSRDELEEIAERFGTPAPHHAHRGAAHGTGVPLAPRLRRRTSRSRTHRARCCCRPPGGRSGSTSARTGLVPPKRRSKHDAIRSRVTTHQPRRGRRGHQPGPAHPLHPGRPAERARQRDPARRRRTDRRVRRRQRQGARRRTRVARLRPADRARHEAGRREARHARRISGRAPTSRSSR